MPDFRSRTKPKSGRGKVAWEYFESLGNPFNSIHYASHQWTSRFDGASTGDTVLSHELMHWEFWQKQDRPQPTSTSACD